MPACYNRRKFEVISLIDHRGFVSARGVACVPFPSSFGLFASREKVVLLFGNRFQQQPLEALC